MLKRLFYKAVLYFLDPKDGIVRDTAPDKARETLSREREHLSDWEQFVYDAIFTRIREAGANEPYAPVSYEYIRDKAKAEDAPFSGYGKIKEAFDSLVDKGIITVRKEGVKNVVYLQKWVRTADY